MYLTASGDRSSWTANSIVSFENQPTSSADNFHVIGIIVFTGFGLFKLQVETDFTKTFVQKAHCEIYDMIESRLGGAGVWDVLIPIKDQLMPKL